MPQGSNETSAALITYSEPAYNRKRGATISQQKESSTGPDNWEEGVMGGLMEREGEGVRGSRKLAEHTEPDLCVHGSMGQAQHGKKAQH